MGYMEKTCIICQKAIPIGQFGSYHKWDDIRQEYKEYTRVECRPCFQTRYYTKKDKSFGTKITEAEAVALREVWPQARTESLAAVHRAAGLKMGYHTFAKHCRSGLVELWYCS